MRYEVEVTTMLDVKEFNEIVAKVEGDVRFSVKDEHGSH